MASGAPMVINADDELLVTADYDNLVKCGFFSISDYRALACEFMNLGDGITREGTDVRLKTPTDSFNFYLSAVGEHNVRNAVQAIAAAEDQSISILQTAERKLASAETQEEAIQKRAASMNEREKNFEEGVKTNYQKWNFPEIFPEKKKKIPIVGDVFSKSYLDRVYYWAAGFVETLQKLIKENTQKKKELDQTLEEQETLKKQMDAVMARLGGKYGEAKEFETWKIAKDAQKKQSDRSQGIRR
jgi:predicted transcriptional regulator